MIPLPSGEAIHVLPDNRVKWYQERHAVPFQAGKTKEPLHIDVSGSE